MSVSLSTVTMMKNARVMHASGDFLAKHFARQAAVETGKLGNGVRFATQTQPANGLATLALHTTTGSRYDIEAKAGVSPLTHRVVAKTVEAEVKALGGKLTVEQDRERQSVFVECLSADAPKVAKALADAVKSPRVAQVLAEARAEQLNEARNRENDIHASIMDSMYYNAYDSTKLDVAPGSAMYLSAVGGDYLKEATEEEVANFAQNFNNANNVSVVATGDFAPETMGAIEKEFSSLEGRTVLPLDKRYLGGIARHDIGEDPTGQNKLALAVEIAGGNSADSVPLELALQMFGSYDRLHGDLSSNKAIRLLRENKDTPQQGRFGMNEMRTFLHQYQDTGLLGWYFTTPLDAQERAAEQWSMALMNEFVEYSFRLDAYRVDYGKNLLKNKFIYESNTPVKANRTIGKQLVSAGAYTPVEQKFARVDRLTTNIVSDVVNHYFYDREPVIAAWGSFNTLPTYWMLRPFMYTWRV